MLDAHIIPAIPSRCAAAALIALIAVCVTGCRRDTVPEPGDPPIPSVATEQARERPQ